METDVSTFHSKVMGDRETEFLGYRFTLVAMHQKLGFSKSHYYSLQRTDFAIFD
jgi:hypothetical protein